MPAVRTKSFDLESFRFSSEKKSHDTRSLSPASIDAKNAPAFEESKLRDFSLREYHSALAQAASAARLIEVL